MKRATKRKPAPAEPLPPPPIPMNLDEPAGPAISPWTQRFLEATAQMSPEKTEVVRLAFDATLANDCCKSIWKCRRECHVHARAIEKEMHQKRRQQNLVPKARTKAQLAERAADEQKVAEVRARRDDYGNQWRVMNHRLSDAREKWAFAKIARLERLLRDAGGEW